MRPSIERIACFGVVVPRAVDLRLDERSYTTSYGGLRDSFVRIQGNRTGLDGWRNRVGGGQ